MVKRGSKSKSPSEIGRGFIPAGSMKMAQRSEIPKSKSPTPEDTRELFSPKYNWTSSSDRKQARLTQVLSALKSIPIPERLTLGWNNAEAPPISYQRRLKPPQKRPHKPYIPCNSFPSPFRPPSFHQSLPFPFLRQHRLSSQMFRASLRRAFEDPTRGMR